MRVLVTTFGGDGGKSGIGQYIIQLLRCFPSVAPDVEWDILMYKEEEELYISDPNAMRPLFYGNTIRNPMANLAWQQVALPLIVAKGKYDALFVPAGNRRMPFWVPCPSIGTFHDFAILHVSGKYDTMHTFYNRHVLPRLVRRLTKVIAISEFSKRDLVDYVKVPEERIEVIMEAADSSQFFPRSRSESGQCVAERYGVRQPYVLYISRIEHPSKNHVRLIRAFARLKKKDKLPHQLVLAGSDWHGAEEVHQEASACGFGDDIVFTGFAKQDDIPMLYCGSEAFIFPSLFEGFGLPILEAMASGVPVACSNTSSLPEVAGNAAHMFDPLNDDAIENALRLILTDETVRTRCLERGLERCTEFSWEKTATQTVGVIRQALEEKV